MTIFQKLILGLTDNLRITILNETVKHIKSRFRTESVQFRKVPGTDGVLYFLNRNQVKCGFLITQKAHPGIGSLKFFPHCTSKLCSGLLQCIFRRSSIHFQICIAHGGEADCTHHFHQFIINIGFSLKSVFRFH